MERRNTNKWKVMRVLMIMSVMLVACRKAEDEPVSTVVETASYEVPVTEAVTSEETMEPGSEAETENLITDDIMVTWDSEGVRVNGIRYTLEDIRNKNRISEIMNRCDTLEADFAYYDARGNGMGRSTWFYSWEEDQQIVDFVFSDNQGTVEYQSFRDGMIYRKEADGLLVTGMYYPDSYYQSLLDASDSVWASKSGETIKNAYQKGDYLVVETEVLLLEGGKTIAEYRTTYYIKPESMEYHQIEGSEYDNEGNRVDKIITSLVPNCSPMMDRSYIEAIKNSDKENRIAINIICVDENDQESVRSITIPRNSEFAFHLAEGYGAYSDRAGKNLLQSIDGSKDSETFYVIKN